jgi:hypothetical protein
MRKMKALNTSRTVRLIATAMLLLGPGYGARADEIFGAQSLRGVQILSLNGSFSSAPPPFTGDRVRLDASAVGRLQFDGNGQVWGEYTLTFHTPTVPVGIRTRFSVFGTYRVEPDGRLLIETDEYVIEPPERRDDVRDNAVTYECYLVQRQKAARCVLQSLVTFQQGPEPIPLPVAMTGTLEAQL